MKILKWSPAMGPAEEANLSYWERNVLALRYAEGWYNDDVVKTDDPPFESPRFEGWRRVLSLEKGSITFHIPDNFEVGNLPEIERNWDGHTTEDKWKMILGQRGVNYEV